MKKIKAFEEKYMRSGYESAHKPQFIKLQIEPIDILYWFFIAQNRTF